jgi:hypothetical protein
VNDLATCGVISIDKFCDGQEGSRSSGEDEEGDECDRDQVQSFTEGHAAYGTARFSCVHISSDHGEQNCLVGTVSSETLGFK